ncbi:MAG TPA: hypothetical protein VFB59_00580 [Candidatus Saccharimonadales bacterium]|nr:hypothetical protein [Candidatus Saccharimonadales bacterium]
MTKFGVLVHVRHPQTIDWEKLVWGVPGEDRLGDLTKLVELILHKSSEQIAAIVMGTTSATRDGLLEGEYTKQYLLDHFHELGRHARLKKYLDTFTDAQVADLRKLFQGIVVTPVIKNTMEEIQAAAQIFKQEEVREVIQITAASHGPRCIQLQATVRAEGHIPKNQMWSVMVSDMCFQDTVPNDTMIMEVPHRGDDPLVHFRPTLPKALKPFYYELTIDDKKKFILLVDEFMNTHKNTK